VATRSLKRARAGADADQVSTPPPSAPAAAHAIPTEPCEACGQQVDFRADACPRCGFPRATGTPLRPASSKSPRNAMWLSLVWPGAGHLYAGDQEKALIFGAASLVLAVLSFTLIPEVVGMLAWLGLALYTAIDSGRELA
jgi:hypothetical protein